MHLDIDFGLQESSKLQADLSACLEDCLLSTRNASSPPAALTLIDEAFMASPNFTSFVRTHLHL